MANRQLPQNVIQIRKDSPINKTVDHIDEALTKFAQVQLNCAGTAVEKMILIAESCVEHGIFHYNKGIAEYSRFTSGLVPYQNREVICTIVKMRRPLKANKNQNKANNQKNQVEKKPQNKKKTNQQQSKQYQGSYHQKGYDRQQDRYRKPQQDRYRKQSYNDDHQKRNERRQKQDYGERNDRNEREGQGKRTNNKDRVQEREYR